MPQSVFHSNIFSKLNFYMKKSNCIEHWTKYRFPYKTARHQSNKSHSTITKTRHGSLKSRNSTMTNSIEFQNYHRNIPPIRRPANRQKSPRNLPPDLPAESRRSYTTHTHTHQRERERAEIVSATGEREAFAPAIHLFTTIVSSALNQPPTKALLCIRPPASASRRSSYMHTLKSVMGVHFVYKSGLRCGGGELNSHFSCYFAYECGSGSVRPLCPLQACGLKDLRSVVVILFGLPVCFFDLFEDWRLWKLEGWYFIFNSSIQWECKKNIIDDLKS